MNTRHRGGLPAPLEGAQRRFERWRRTRKIGSRIPEPLWDAAVKAARACGVARTARALSVDYYGLKKRLEAACSLAASEAGAEAAFFELPRPASAGFRECILEWEHADGAKMRAHLKGLEAPDLEALSRRFWGLES